MLRRKYDCTVVAAIEMAKRGFLFTMMALVFAACAAAQTPEPSSAATTQASPEPHRHARNSIDDRVTVFAKSLDLSVTQQAQLRTILEERQQQIVQLRANTSLLGEARIDRFRALQDQTVERIRAILTDDQKKKYDPLTVRKVQQQQNTDVDKWLAATRPH